jgi:uncharacterized protein involved in exopolysaccharide biosynthesis
MNDMREPAAEEEVRVLDLLVVLARHKLLLLRLPIAFAVVAALLSLLLPNYYTGVARILPPQQSQGTLAAALLGSLGTLAGGVAGSIGIKNPSDLYVGMLQSQAVVDPIIQRFDLRKLYEKETLLETRKALADATSITVGKDGIISIEVDDKDPRRAAAMANAYVAELDRLTQSVAITDAGRKRVYLERQLAQAKDRLAEAEVVMRATMEKTGLIRLEDQGRVMIESVAALRAQVAAKEVQLAAMRMAMTDNNPDYLRTRQELAGMRKELAKLESDTPGGNGSVIPSAGSVPESGLEYVRRLREVKYHEMLFEALAKQYEIARSEEAADAAQVQVLDRAIEPDDKSKPSRALITILAGLLGGILAVLAAFAFEARRDPRNAAQIDEIRQLLRRR